MGTSLSRHFNKILLRISFSELISDTREQQIAKGKTNMLSPHIFLKHSEIEHLNYKESSVLLRQFRHETVMTPLDLLAVV